MKKRRIFNLPENSQTHLIDSFIILYLTKNSLNRLLNILGKDIIVVVIVDNLSGVFVHLIIIFNRHMVVKLSHLKNVGIKIRQSYFSKTIVRNFCPGLHQEKASAAEE